MRDFIYSLMTDRKNGASVAPLKFVLYLVSLVYGLGILIRSILYKFEIFKTSKAPIKVISIGNLTLGGTGKTPFVIWLARTIKKDMGREASVLIRGYGWDEQAMLKTHLADTPILVGEDRVKSAYRAIRLYGAQTAILDDGFQYWELARDLNIVLIDSRSPFGNGYLFPRGILREPKSAITRADVVVFTKANKKAANIGALKEELRAMNGKLIFLEAFHKPKYLYDVKAKKELDVSRLAGRRVVLISSIGDPAYFEETIKDLGGRVAEHIVFPDHHDYTELDMKQIMKRLNERSFEAVVTTEKDAVKLNRLHFSFGDYELFTLGVEMDITDGKERLIARLNSLYTG